MLVSVMLIKENKHVYREDARLQHFSQILENFDHFLPDFEKMMTKTSLCNSFIFSLSEELMKFRMVTFSSSSVP